MAGDAGPKHGHRWATIATALGTGREIWFPILQSLREASTPLINWRQRRNLRDAVLIVWGEDEQLGLEIVHGLDDVKLKRKIEKMLATSERCVPRRFFWTTAA